MKLKPILFGALTLLTLDACQQKDREGGNSGPAEVEAPAQKETPEKMIETLVGEWRLASGGGDASESTQGGRTLTFTNEARYILREGEQKADSGAFRMNEQLQNLYLESETNQQPREFEVKLSQDSLVLSPKTGDGSRQVYVRND